MTFVSHPEKLDREKLSWETATPLLLFCPLPPLLPPWESTAYMFRRDTLA